MCQIPLKSELHSQTLLKIRNTKSYHSSEVSKFCLFDIFFEQSMGIFGQNQKIGFIIL